ncbi:XrtA/PEP-CTERM system histidine kinase PrsK [Thioalkalivibrio sp. XN8]|uniref:XrtA/PEP-CTERM system histidine kinase PrsK n=1 Tax=Thioalkalivibrio sp. XN8 TaxID=2712863 RepID=UPI0013EC1B62|nr:XrtA/PEP-CTERM system histidine kinase PrsK [Thioalkalivibrio sp. XN8]NGP53728.1 PEP-CTERM system histidine kinase PrsK [Thioalkalivibrio sp. XN8]
MTLIGTLGYGLAAIAFALLALLMLTSWRGRLQGGLLVIAAGLSAAWAAAAAFPGDSPQHWQLVGVLEILRNTAWLAFLARLTPAGQGVAGLTKHFASLAPAAFVLVYGLLTIFLPAAADPVPQVIRTLVTTGLVTAIAGLVLLEQFYRALKLELRRPVLPLILGVGGLLAYDLFLYSHGLLFRGIHAELWLARGYIAFLAAPLILLAAGRSKEVLSVDVFISRHVAFYTASLVGIGVYLVVMAVAGYGLRVAGGEWGVVLQAAFFFGAAILLGWIVLSPGARAELRVFIAKHFYRAKYDYRREWINLTQRLSEGNPAEGLEQRSLDAMIKLADGAGGALWIRSTDRQPGGYVLAAEIAPPGDSPRDCPHHLPTDDLLVSFLADRRWIIDLAQARNDPESHPNFVAPNWLDDLGPAALIVPLLKDEQLWGLVVIRSPRLVGHLSYEDIDLFRIAGMQVAAVLAQAEADRLLAESRQFEAYNRFAAFIMHDLKNVIAQQSLVVRNAAKYRDDPEFIDDTLDTVANSVDRMQKLLEQLKRGQGANLVERVDVHRIMLEIVNRHTDRDPAPTASCADATLRLRVDRERFAAVLGHLVTNAQDATPPGGRVTIEATLEGGALVVAVEDDGEGMDEAFLRERLFKPFDSTKGSKGMGIGAYQARQFVESAGGEVRVRSAPGEGTRFELRFPARLVEYGTGDTGQFMAPSFARTQGGGNATEEGPGG